MVTNKQGLHHGCRRNNKVLEDKCHHEQPDDEYNTHTGDRFKDRLPNLDLCGRLSGTFLFVNQCQIVSPFLSRLAFQFTVTRLMPLVICNSSGYPDSGTYLRSRQWLLPRPSI